MSISSCRRQQCARCRLSLHLSLLLFLLLLTLPVAAPAEKLRWEGWSPEIFRRAADEKRLVLLDLEAVWCHWCHVMDQQTYGNPQVRSYLEENFLLVRVDQDSRPDLSNAFKDYGWPATIIFNERAQPLRKLRGFIEPDELLTVLRDVKLRPEPLAEEPPRYAAESNLAPQLRDALRQRHLDSFDSSRGGLRLKKKYLDVDSVEYDLVLAHSGDQAARARATKTLDAGLRLIDPVWGGMFQYSTHGDWEHPHYEKIASSQRNALRLYTGAHRLLEQQRYKQAGVDIHRYLQSFLRAPDGGFYTSQDADVTPGSRSDEYFRLSDAARRNIGIPRIDRNQYARENFWFVEGLLDLFDMSGDDTYLSEATRTVEWLLASRRDPSGGFRHGERAEDQRYLGDTLAAASALVHLYATTGERRWLERATEAGDFIIERFVEKGDPGVVTSVSSGRALLAPTRTIPENISAVRTLNLLGHYTGRSRYIKAARDCMRYLVTEEIAKSTITEPGVLLADYELANPPLHVTVVGSKSSVEARALLAAARRYPGFYKRTEWWDRSEGPLPNSDVTYPEVPRPAAYVCTAKRCSLPVLDPELLAPAINTLSAKQKAPPSGAD